MGLEVLVVPAWEEHLENWWFLTLLNLSDDDGVLVSSIGQRGDVLISTLVRTITLELVGVLTDPNEEFIEVVKNVHIHLHQASLREGWDLLHVHVAASVTDLEHHRLEARRRQHQVLDLSVVVLAAEELPELIWL